MPKQHTMTRQHFQAIADTIAPLVRHHRADSTATFVLDEVVEELADMCQRANSNFDRARFITACGSPNVAVAESLA